MIAIIFGVVFACIFTAVIMDIERAGTDCANSIERSIRRARENRDKALRVLIAFSILAFSFSCSGRAEISRIPVAIETRVILARRKQRKPQANGIVFYHGPSMLDGSSIVAILTGLKKRSANAKTGGGLLQTWILREEEAPHVAQKTGADRSVCGPCQLRPVIMRLAKRIGFRTSHAKQCYVKTYQAPLAVWRAYRRGRYPELADLRLAGRVRVGSYGNPSAIPIYAWNNLFASGVTPGTGYDHNWILADRRFSSFVMASVSSAAEATEAVELGYRYFRVRKMTDPILTGEIVCPASKEWRAANPGRAVTCDKCLLCNGRGLDGARATLKNIVIAEH